MEVKIPSRIVTGLMLLLGCTCLFLFGVGCGASRSGTVQNEETVNIDDLLGDDEQSPEQTDADEAEVLRLLGINQDQPQATAVAAVVPEDPMTEELERDLSLLKQDLLDREAQISELRSELTGKEMQISDLQANLQEQQKIVPVMALASVASGSSTDFATRYQEALGHYKDREYQTAINLLRELIQSDPHTTLSDNCQYWIGESYFGLPNYDQAIIEFEKVFSFADSNKSDDAQLKLGICHLKLGNQQQAQAEFNRLLSSYPDSEYLALAKRYLSGQ